MRDWGGAGVGMLVCTRGGAFEMDWWWFEVSVELTSFLQFLAIPREVTETVTLICIVIVKELGF